MKRKFVWPGILLAIGMVLLPACSKRKAEQTEQKAEQAEQKAEQAEQKAEQAEQKAEQKDWFSRAQMGMSSAQVREILPDMKNVEGGEESHTSPKRFERYITTGQPFEGLQGCRVELRFFEDGLWVIIVNYEDNPTEEVERILKERYGEPTRQYGDVARWSGSGLEVVLKRKAKWISFSDETVAEEATKAFFGRTEHGEGVTGDE